MELDLFELQEAFTYFDEDHDGKINPDEFADMARALGFSPTEAELMSIQKVIEVRYQGYLKFPEFKDMLEKYLLPMQESLSSAPQTIKDCFNIFNSLCRSVDKDTISIRDLRLLTTKFGDKLEPSAFDSLLAATPRTGTGSELAQDDIVRTVMESN